MKTSVRFLSMLLAVIMLAGAALTASAGNAEKTANSEALQLLVDLGIFGGYDDGTLKPDNLVERDEMAKIIFVLYTTFQDAGEGAVSFTDVAADNWAAGYISWCSSKGIVGGYGDGKFGPDDNVTYDQALKMVCGALGYNEWDSKLWPIDVRTKALRELGLGENITGVNGTDYVTRAQIAQIVYNALFANMNETKTVNVPFGDGSFEVPVEVAMTLAVDVWSFGQVVTSVVDVKVDEETEELIAVLANGAEYKFDEIGLAAYKNNISDILYASVTLAYNTKKVADPANLKAEEIIASSLTLNSVKDVEITYDDKKDVVLVNGEKIADNAIAVINDMGRANTVALDKNAVPAEDVPYFSRGYDFDADGKFDMVYWTYLFAAETTNVTEKKTTFALYGDSNATQTFNNDEIVLAAALEEEDVVIFTYDIAETKVSAPIAPVEAKATKYNSKALTLDGVGEVAINKAVFYANPVCTVDGTVMDVNDKGETTANKYYIYDGKVFGADVIVSKTALNFAVLSYINAPSEAVFNPTTMDFDTGYTARITINGKEQTVDLNARDTIDGLNMVDNGAEILSLYGKVFTNDGETEVAVDEFGKYVLNRYILVTYTVDEDGFYTFSTQHQSDEDYTVYAPNATLEYNKKTGLFSLTDEAGQLISKTVNIDPAASLYYTYFKETTGYHKYLGTYTAETLPEGFTKATLTSDIFATIDEETGFVNVKIAVLDNDSIETIEEEKADFRTDSRQLFYCYQSSNEAMAEDSVNLNYTHFMASIFKPTKLAEATNTELTAAEGAKKSTQGYIYAWDDETKNYIRLTKSNLEENGVTSIGIYTLTNYVNGCIFTEDGSKFEDGFKVTSDISIWCLGGDAKTIVTLDLAGLQKSLDIAEEGEFETRLIVGTYLDENGKEVISSIIIQQHVFDKNGKPARNTTTLMNGFAG